MHSLVVFVQYLQCTDEMEKKLLVKYVGNSSPRYDGHIWSENVKSLLAVNGKVVAEPELTKIKPGDVVLLQPSAKGGKKGKRIWTGKLAVCVAFFDTSNKYTILLLFTRCCNIRTRLTRSARL